MAEAEVICDPTKLVQEWEPGFIVLSFAISVLGAFAGLTTITYAFVVLRQPHLRKWFVVYVIASGIQVGGVAVWAMHFVGMQALILHTCDGVQVPLVFNFALTFISLVAACAIGSIDMYLVLPVVNKQSRVLPTKSGNREAELQYWTLPFKVNGAQVKLGKFSPARYALAVALLMAGACIMHYMGMMAMYGPYYIEFNGGFVFASAVIAFVASAAGLFIVIQIAYVGQTWFSIVMRVVASIIISIAVNAMHYTGMVGATYVFTGDKTLNLNEYIGANIPIPALIVCVVAVAFSVGQMLLVHAHLTALASQTST